jgi:hypothetical protein
MTRSRGLTLIVCMIAIALVAGCGGGGESGEADRATTCSPSWPTVTPSIAQAGATIKVESEGVRSCTYPHRLRSYELRLKTNALGFERTGPRLGTVIVDPRSRFVGAQVQIPVGTPPGRYYVTYAPAPTDHYRYPTGCYDVRFNADVSRGGSFALVSCSVAGPNLVVIP